MSKILQISEIGSPILRDRSTAIANLADPQLDELIDNLMATAHSANGVGIAAPQVASSIRLFIVASRPSPRYPHAPTMEPTAMINPEIVARSGELVAGWEGCLSVPGQRGLVLRDRAIEVKYFTKHGELVRQELTDFVARIFQHELDHLDGILFPDRVSNPTELITEAEYMKIAFDR
ncbi:peptide deformylase [Chamaesiphon minutus]|uniref:Peptide deformylase n=1 Tax=Chamaesiphon minutus (strain ATCC 27169 / PCC 6605) TaxID=1173020 RepID=K9UB25_CHAP6|nr:peptide deformylase [Chamaesiphon minutus]AFY91818.1 peptide deformylase [Chamaesiphon minutus PCC 6605]